MTEIKNGILVIQPEPHDECEMCGKTDELRPYGPNCENACFDCCAKDPEARDRQFAKRMGETQPVNPNDN